VVNVWHGAHPVHPRSSGDAPGTPGDKSRGHRIKWWIVTLLPVVVVIAVCSVGVTLVFNSTRSLGNGLNSIDQGFARLGQKIELGGTAANTAASVAASQASGSLSISTLNAELPKYVWVDGATNVPLSSLKRPIVGVNIIGTSIETAAQPARSVCSYGLAITSSADPLIAEDHLPSPGTYYQDVFSTTQCAADHAPTSSWMAWSLPDPS
jgi:hypothetical protein